MPTIEEVTARYIELRDQVSAIAERHKEELAPLNAKMEQIETWFLAKMQQDGVDSYKCAAGTPYKSVGTNVGIEDNSVFRNFLFAPGAKAIASYVQSMGINAINEQDTINIMNFITTSIPWNLADIRAGKKGIQEYIEQTGVTPPGIKISQYAKVNIRRT